MWIHLSGAFCHCLRKLFSRQLLEIWVQILLLQPLQLLGHSPFPIQDGILALLKGPIFSFASAHNVNELHAHSMRLQQMLVAQSQTITWSRWQYTLIENFEDPAEGTPSVSRSSFVSHAGSWLRLIAPVLEVGVWSQKIQPSFSSSNPPSRAARRRFGFFTGVHFFLSIFQITWLYDPASPALFLKTERKSGRKGGKQGWGGRRSRWRWE